MTLQKLLLMLSKNKEISVECFCVDECLTVILKEWYTFKELKKVVIDLKGEIDGDTLQKFIPYLQ